MIRNRYKRRQFQRAWIGWLLAHPGRSLRQQVQAAEAIMQDMGLASVQTRLRGIR